MEVEAVRDGQDAPAEPDHARHGGIKRLGARLARAVFTPACADVCSAFLLHQALFLGAVLVAASLLPPYSGDAYPTWHTGAPWLVDASWRWDGQWYASIATEGYRLAAGAYQNVAFFPLYPLLIRAAAAPFGEGAVPIAGALIPRFALLAALAYLYRLVEAEQGREVAARAVLYLALYPAALFFSAAYGESLFLLTSVAGFYYARRRRWWPAGACGFLATLTRPQGLLLVIPLAYELWQDAPAPLARRVARACSILLPPAGLAAFMLYLHWTTGDALAFAHAQSAWLRSFGLPHEALYRATILAIVGEPNATRHAMGIINTAAAVFFLGAGLWLLRRQPLSYAMYTLAALVLPLALPVPDMPTVSMARFTAVLFPVFVLLGDWGRRPGIHHFVLVAFAALFALLAALFANWYWVV